MVVSIVFVSVYVWIRGVLMVVARAMAVRYDMAPCQTLVVNSPFVVDLGDGVTL